MGWLPYALALYVFAVGLYGMVTSRNLVHLAVCLNVSQSATYVLLLVVGYRDGGVVPVASARQHAPFVDPLVQTLALTDIVVGAAVTALLLALAVQVHKRRGTLDPNELAAQQG